ncbi:hypothetical protein BC827DRAFT_1198471 [Russula dissimulans]|nr:hypothetical protein BC827DRAFT_1198471 [Russula dissimulans]
MLTSRDLVAFLAALLTLIVAITRRKTSNSKVNQRISNDSTPTSPAVDVKSKSDEPNKDRRPGEYWTPVKFRYPPVAPITEALDQIPPRPYRPYKPGRYHVTMGIRPMHWESWIELDRDFAAYYRLRGARLASPRGPKLHYTLPDRPHLVQGGADAARELMHELAEFLVARYPGVYRATRRRGDDGESESEIVAVEVLPVGVTHNLEAEDPIVVAAMLSQDDLAIMIEGRDGQYYLQAGAVLLAGPFLPFPACLPFSPCLPSFI